MINKDKLKGFVSGILVASFLGTTVFATPIQKQITATYDNIKLYVDGKLVQVRDSNGNNIEPFIVNGSTYVPIRTVGQAFNKEVAWDEERSSVYIGKQPTIEQTEVIVSNVDELVAALGSNKHIKLQPGTYNLSKIKDRDKHVSSLEWGSVFDGYELTLSELSNLTIEGIGDSSVEIVTDARFAYVFSFIECDKVSLKNLKLGHTYMKDYDCNAGVVRLESTSDININNSILYGCGSIGLFTSYVTDLEFNNSIIENCNAGVMSIRNSENLNFYNSTFRNCINFSMFDFIKSEKVKFNNCVIDNNESQNGFDFIYSSNSIVKFLNCKFTNNKAAIFKKLQISHIDFTGTVFEGNSFDVGQQ